MRHLMMTAKGLFWLGSVAIAIVSLGILLALGPEGYPGMMHHVGVRDVSLYCHVLAAALALLLLPLQVWTGLRRIAPHMHRILGRVSAVAILIGGISGLHLAIFANTGPVAQLGFGTLSVIWLVVTGIAVQAARSGDLGKHRRWIAYSGALTFAAVTLRLQIPTALVLGGDFNTFYPMISWTCWVPNLIAVWGWRQLRGRGVISTMQSA
jgi:uncharacterized membrane protein